MLAHLVAHAELDGVVCSGALQGKQHTYALLEERVPPAPVLERDEAVAELVGRYFASHGPATLNDFAWWSGLTVGDARRGLAAHGARNVIVIDGEVLGIWKRSVVKERLRIEPWWFNPPPRLAEAAFAEAGERYAAFVGLPLQSAVG